MTISQRILDNQLVMMKDMGNMKEDIGQIKGVVVGSNGGGHEGRIKTLEENQGKFLTVKTVMIILSSYTLMLGGLTLITKLAGFW